MICAGAVQTGLSVLPSQYPAVRRDNVTDDFFGTVVADPYRWLEDTDSNETLACEWHSLHPFPSCMIMMPRS